MKLLRMALSVVVVLTAWAVGDVQGHGRFEAQGLLGPFGQIAPKLYKANTMEAATDNSHIQLRGDAQIQSGDFDIRADEADIARGRFGAAREITLGGNVRI